MFYKSKKILMDTLIFSFIFFILELSGYYLSGIPDAITNLSVSTVVGVALLLRYQIKSWGFPLLVIGIASFFSHQLLHDTLAASFYHTVVSLAEIVITSWVLFHYQVLGTFDHKIKAAMILLLTCILIGPVMNATLNSLFFSSDHALTLWANFFVSDGICLIMSLPIVLCLLRKMWKKLTVYNSIKFFIFLLISFAVTYTALIYLPYAFIIVLMPLLVVAVTTSIFITLLIACLNVFFIFTLYNAGIFVPLLRPEFLLVHYIYVPTIFIFIPTYFLSVFMTMLRKAEQDLEVSENQFRGAMENSGVGMALVLLDGHWYKVNRALCEILGYSEEELQKLTFWDVTYPEDIPVSMEYAEKLKKGEVNFYHIDKRYIGKQGNIIWIHLSVSLFHNKIIPASYYVVQVEDVTQRKNLELMNELLNNALYDEKERLNTLLTSIADSVIATDNKGLITFMNPEAERITGWKFEEANGVLHETVFVIVSKKTHKALRSPITFCLNSGKTSYLIGDALLINKTGKTYDIQGSASLLKNKSNEVMGTVLVFQNVSQAKTFEKTLNYNATHDALTGLLNRREFEKILKEMLHKKKNAQHVLCYLDLDNFKIVNDSAGHAAGDALLKEVAKLMHKQIRSSDILARLGGDEFSILFINCPLDVGKELSEKMINLINSLRFNWKNKIYRVGASVGLVALTDHTQSVNQLLSEADIACYSAKEAGRNRVSIYQIDRAEVAEHHREILLASTLREAADNNRFILYAQKIIPLNDDKHIENRYEILLRMFNENGVIIEASAFIPIAERFNLMANIDRWVLTELLEHYGEKLSKIKNANFSINLSADSLNDPQFLPFLLTKIEQSAIPTKSLCFEITETAAMNQIAETVEIVNKLQEIGCQIALDDFGAGLSSFTYLKNFSVNFIKIDGSFVKNVTEYEADATIVEAINEVAHRLKIKTVAEAVESQEILKVITEIGIDYVQGYATGVPEPLDNILKKN